MNNKMKDVKFDILEMKLSNTDFKGVATLSFSQPIELLRNESLQNWNELMHLEVKSAIDLKKFKMNWTITEYKPSFITFLIEFEDPLNVSLHSDELKQ